MRIKILDDDGRLLDELNIDNDRFLREIPEIRKLVDSESSIISELAESLDSINESGDL